MARLSDDAAAIVQAGLDVLKQTNDLNEIPERIKESVSDAVGNLCVQYAGEDPVHVIDALKEIATEYSIRRVIDEMSNPQAINPRTGRHYWDTQSS